MPTYWKHQQVPPKKAKKPWRPGPRKATGERELFAQVWETCDRRCEICGVGIREPAPWSFSHKLPKSTFPEYRLVPTNLAIVCSLGCHAAVDRQRKTMTAEWVRENDAWLREKENALK